LAGGHRIFWQPLPKCCRPGVELTAYKSYSIPAGVLGGFAVSHANVWHRGRKVTLVPAHFRLHPHLACRLPYRFPRGRFTPLPRVRVRVPAPWLPYRFPRGRLGVDGQHFGNSRGFPTDFPVVGCERPNVLESRIIARELREQVAPIEPCGTRLDIVRIAGFDMAGDLLQRRCPITASCTKPPTG